MTTPDINAAICAYNIAIIDDPHSARMVLDQIKTIPKKHAHLPLIAMVNKLMDMLDAIEDDHALQMRERNDVIYDLEKELANADM